MSFLLNSFRSFPASGGPPTFVGGTSGNFIDGGGGTISLTGLTGGIASSPSTGDIVIVVIGCGSQSLRNITCSYGTSIAALQSDDSFDSSLTARYKIQTSTPDTSINVSGTANVTDSSGYCVHVWRNISSSSPLDVATTTATGLNTPDADPPAITPVTAGAIIIAMGTGGGGTLTAYTGPTTSFGRANFFSGWGADTVDGVAGIYAYTAWTSGAYNPPAFTGGGGASTSAWCAATIALRPA